VRCDEDDGARSFIRVVEGEDLGNAVSEGVDDGFVSWVAEEREGAWRMLVDDGSEQGDLTKSKAYPRHGRAQ
jgi:hypothetical protein